MKGYRGGKFLRLSKTDLAEARGVSLNTVYGWVRQGVPKNKDGTFDLPEVSGWLDKRGASKVGSLEKERARLAREQADKLQMENAQTRGELVHVDDAASAVESIIIAIRAKALSLGTKLAPQVVVCNNVNEVKAIIDAGADDFLRELAEINPAGTRGTEQRDPEAAPAGPAAAEAVRQRVGRPKPRPVARKQRRARGMDNKPR